jgi:hypothetical protein
MPPAVHPTAYPIYQTTLKKRESPVMDSVGTLADEEHCWSVDARVFREGIS